MAFYRKPGKDCWTGRVDGDDPDLLRWHQIMQFHEPERLPPIENGKQGVALIGFVCDEGVRRNNGRVGAASAPEAIRKAAGNFPLVAHHIVMADVGDVVCDDGNMEEAQAILAEKIMMINASGFLPIVLGGGHETAFSSYLSLGKLSAKDELGFINFDAHFDLRAVEPETGPNSGTWAWQIAEDCRKKKVAFHYLILGIQQYSNTRRLFEMAQEMGAPYFLAEQFTNDQLFKMLHTINGVISHADRLLLSIDMDVFAAPFAPGVSALSFNGIAPNAMFKRLLRHIMLSGKVHCVDISELNPVFDTDTRTAKLAAAFVFDIVQAADINAEYPG